MRASETWMIIDLDVIDTNTRNNDRIVLKIFYDKITDKSFNLQTYLSTFESKKITIELGSPLRHLTRGLFFFTETGFIVVIWKTSVAHVDVARGLDKAKKKFNLPQLNYFKLYNQTYTATKRTKLEKDWCFPVVMLNNQLISNITTNALFALLKQKEIDTVFELTDEQVKELIKKSRE